MTWILNAAEELVDRIVDGTLWYRDPSKQEVLTSIYNEDTREKEKFSFRYFR